MSEIPKFDYFMKPVLESARHRDRKISDVVEEITEALDLPDELKAKTIPSGKQTVIRNRVHWARSYLKQAALVENPKRGWFSLTDRGRKVLESGADLDVQFLEQFPEYQEFKARTRDESSDVGESEGGLETPDEDLSHAHARLERILAGELLSAIQGSTPSFFEQLIVDLFIAMGYGGDAQNAGRALGQSGDRGVDGVIDQDALGVDQIYLQAKRYDSDNTVGPSDIRDFFGALNLRRATKGIFVTTSSFTNEAVKTANDLGSRIVLIDGKKLTSLMIRFDVGVARRYTLDVKELDENYFTDI